MAPHFSICQTCAGHRLVRHRDRVLFHFIKVICEDCSGEGYYEDYKRELETTYRRDYEMSLFESTYSGYSNDG